MLANELGRRGISAVLVDEKPGTAFNPQANATQARTMEHFRRLGIAEEIRSLGLPPDFPTDIAYFTRYATHELGRFRLPTARQARERVSTLKGAWGAAELPHRVSQKFVEAVLRKHAEKLPGISVNYGWRMTAFRDSGDAVEVEVERIQDGERQTLRADYLVGADGPRSPVRQQLGFRYAGETGVARDFMGGRMYAIYLRAPDFYEAVPHDPAWMNVSFNADRRAFMAAVDGKGEFAFHTQLKPHENEDEITDDEAARMFQRAVGAPVKTEVLSRRSWTAGHALVADHFQRGRVFLGGDAVHLFTPTGGLGYNTAVEDAVNLGWKLAAVLKGQAAPALLDSYEAERRPLAVRNTGYARRFADSLGLFMPVPELEEDSDAGREARRKAGEYLEAHGRAEFNIPGITFGGRYDGSPAIFSDGTRPPPDAANEYIPSACPGGRPPHIWVGDGVSLYDTFGPEWTLLALGPQPPDATPFLEEAARLGLEMTRVAHPAPEILAMYEAPLALIRPDQIVAWRGHNAGEAPAVLARLTGRAPPPD
ncbi:2-polyprenyl-6-methoxyphenol hydroxylase [Noviherbaspirillum humi]|uniref:2-polyprenyl-6-methoxyphenol hydroxylase n=2 Tax=Noviherbaspirillum humi TaxID=1688639 RepID=A0A239I3V8_9BURK|nr:2-polyprenyl-6-methoxyphenol hydroxylase [Noviherbaspirillum humi]